MGMLKKIAVTVAACAISCMGVPAYALQDIAIEDSTTRNSSVTTVDEQTTDDDQESMPNNPNMKLPDTVSEDIPDDATVVSEDLAVTSAGEIKNIETGETVTDENLVGTQTQQPDPLAKTDGESFIPVDISEVKEAVEQTDNTLNSDSGQVSESSATTSGTVSLAKFDSNEYGAHWGTYNNTKAFFDYQNNLFVQQAKGVIDVSVWQGDIDWDRAKADGVEGAIIRLGFGSGNSVDGKAQRNISECKRLGIPFGIYWYSYSYDSAGAREEGEDVVAKLKQLGVSPSDLSYPIYYDLEQWTWTGHTPPTDPNVYNDIVNTWYGVLQSSGYTNLGVYSYTSYLQGPLNHSNIYSKTTWVAQYGAVMGFNSFPTNSRGWQYTSSGQIDGISGNVDMNAFGNKDYVNGGSTDTCFYVTNTLRGGTADFSFWYGRAGDEVYIGDWDGDGTDTLAVRRGNAFYIRNSLSGGEADVVLYYGRAGDEVLVGDWDGDGKDTLAVRRGNEYHIKNSISSGVADVVVYYGRSGDAVLTGDWDGDGKDTLAVRRDNQYFFRNTMSDGPADYEIYYGRSNDQVLVGDWDGDEKDTLAVRRGNICYVKNTISSGVADVSFSYGREGDSIYAGDWDADNKDTFMVRR